MEENVDASAELARSLAQMSVDCPWCPKGRRQSGLVSNNNEELLNGNDTSSDEEEGGVADEFAPWDWTEFSSSEEDKGAGSEFHTEGWANWGGSWQNKKSGLEPAYEGAGVKKSKEKIFTEGIESVQQVTNWLRERGVDQQDLRLFVRLSIMSIIRDQKGGSRRLYEFISPFVATSGTDTLNEKWDSKGGYANEFTKCMTAIIADISDTVKFALEPRKSYPQDPEVPRAPSFLEKLYQLWRAGSNPLKGQFTQPLAKFFVALEQRMRDFIKIYTQRRTLSISDRDFARAKARFELWFSEADANFPNPSDTDLGLAKFSALNYLNGYLSTGPQLPQMPSMPHIPFDPYKKRFDEMKQIIVNQNEIMKQLQQQMDRMERSRAPGPEGVYDSMTQQQQQRRQGEGLYNSQNSYTESGQGDEEYSTGSYDSQSQQSRRSSNNGSVYFRPQEPRPEDALYGIEEGDVPSRSNSVEPSRDSQSIYGTPASSVGPSDEYNPDADESYGELPPRRATPKSSGRQDFEDRSARILKDREGGYYENFRTVPGARKSRGGSWEMNKQAGVYRVL